MLLWPKMALLQGVTLTYIKIIVFRNGNVAYQIKGNEAYTGFYRTQYPASYTHKSLGRTPQFTLPASAGTQTCLLCLSLKSKIPKLFRNDSVFPIFTAYL